MQAIICGLRDSARAVGGMELWHIPREDNRRPLCGARLSGSIRSSKGEPKCGGCTNLDTMAFTGVPERQLLLDVRDRKVTRERLASGNTPTYTVFDMGLIKHARDGFLVLTERGKTVVRDLEEPVPVFDLKDKLLHERQRLSDVTKCGIRVLPYNFSISVLAAMFKLIEDLGRKTPTCVRCLGTVTWEHLG